MADKQEFFNAMEDLVARTMLTDAGGSEYEVRTIMERGGAGQDMLLWGDNPHGWAKYELTMLRLHELQQIAENIDESS